MLKMNKCCIYMEFIKMVLMNTAAGQRWRCRHREQAHGPGARGHWGRTGGTDGEKQGSINTAMCKPGSRWEFAA